jgi:hypothetical protein
MPEGETSKVSEARVDGCVDIHGCVVFLLATKVCDQVRCFSSFLLFLYIERRSTVVVGS